MTDGNTLVSKPVNYKVASYKVSFRFYKIFDLFAYIAHFTI
jgi:hypothetical protein